jgi:hypothetical protein
LPGFDQETVDAVLAAAQVELAARPPAPEPIVVDTPPADDDTAAAPGADDGRQDESN